MNRKYLRQCPGIAAWLLIVLSISLAAQENEDYTHWDIAPNLNRPWEILWGPDDWLWYTERPGRVGRVNPSSGQRITLLELPEVELTHEGGLMGMALHPNFSEQPLVYLVYSFINEHEQNRQKVVSYRYDPLKQVLLHETLLIPDFLTNGFHLGSRLLIGPDLSMFVTVGDRGFSPAAQDHKQLNGKILRVMLDGSIPSDNPYPNSLLWSTGHRNPQGLDFGRNGILYSSEHGTAQDDEFNIILRQRNYGWPDVEGKCDNFLEEPFCLDSNVAEPIYTWTPTVAVSGLRYYDHAEFPEWRNSVLIATLKNAAMMVMRMSDDGREVLEEREMFADIYGRMRDFAISPSGRLFISLTNKERDIPLPDRIVEIFHRRRNARLDLSAEQLDFEETINFSALTKVLRVSNIGDEPCRLYDFRLEGAGAAAFEMAFSERMIILEAGEERELPMRFVPDRAGRMEARLEFHSNTADGDFSLPLSGRARTAPQTDQHLINFGRLSAGAWRDTILRLNGDGIRQEADLQIQGAASFSLTRLTIPAEGSGEPTLAALRFAPQHSGPATARLLVPDQQRAEPREYRLFGNTGDLAVMDSELDFGALIICSSFERRLDVVNISKSFLTIDEISLNPAAADEWRFLGALPVELASNAAAQIRLVFEPKTVGIKSAALSLRTSRGDVENVSLRGIARAGLATNAVEVDFGIVRPTEFRDTLMYFLRPTTAPNSSEDDRIRLEGSEAFALVCRSSKGRQAGDSLIVALRFAPGDSLPQKARLHVEFDGELESRTVTLLGNGATTAELPDPPTAINVFRVLPNPVTSAAGLQIELSDSKAWTILIYDALGRVLRELQGNAAAGETIVVPWNLLDEYGERVRSGYYRALLIVGQSRRSVAMVLRL